MSSTETDKVDPRHEMIARPDTGGVYDFNIYTDGSGHQDGFGGHGALVVSDRFGDCFSVCGAASHTTVYRQELSGVLVALREIFVRYGNEGTLTIHATIDSESLVYAMARHKDTAEPIFKRSTTDGDLWAAYLFYEKKFIIVPEHMKRTTDKMHDIADMMASEMRIFIKEYFLNSPSCYLGGQVSYQQLQTLKAAIAKAKAAETKKAEHAQV